MADNQFFDVTDTFKREQQRIRERQLAALAQATQATTPNPRAGGEMVGRVRTVGNQAGSILQGIAAPFINDNINATADAERADLDARFKTDYDAWMADKPDELAAVGNPRLMEDWIGRGQQFGKRADLEHEFSRDAATQRFRRDEAERAREARAAEALATRIARSEESEKDREARKELRTMPSIHVNNTPQREPRERFQIVTDEKGVPHRVSLDTGVATPVEGVIKATPSNKLNAAQQKALDDSDVFVQHIDNALGLLKQNPDALGAKTMIPDVALQRIDPEGVSTRAAVGGLSAEKVHQLSGAAVSPAEFARLRPYLPSAGDDQATAVKKLQGLRAEAQRIRDRHAKGPTTPADKDATVTRRVKLKNGKIGVEWSDGRRTTE